MACPHWHCRAWARVVESGPDGGQDLAAGTWQRLEELPQPVPLIPLSQPPQLLRHEPRDLGPSPGGGRHAATPITRPAEPRPPARAHPRRYPSSRPPPALPVLLGAGRRLFDSLPSRIELEIIRVIDTPQATHIRYRVRR